MPYLKSWDFGLRRFAPKSHDCYLLNAAHRNGDRSFFVIHEIHNKLCPPSVGDETAQLIRRVTLIEAVHFEGRVAVIDPESAFAFRIGVALLAKLSGYRHLDGMARNKARCFKFSRDRRTLWSI